MWTALRRLFWLALLGGAGYGAYATWQRKHEPQPDGPPSWPPLDDAASPAPPVTTAEPEPAADEPTATAGFASVSDTDQVDAPGETDDHGDAPSAPAGQRWVEPVDGACPPGYPIKGNDNSGIYHVPGGRFYDRTVPERCYANEADAEADGYRRAKA